MNRDDARHLVKEATARCWCSKSRSKFGIVLVSSSGGYWIVKHSFLCSEHYVDAASECRGEIAQIELSDDYNGCKHCRNNSLIQCDACKEFSCYNAGVFSFSKSVTCGNCGMRGVVAGTAKSIKLSGD